jgi:hypothetical protein
MQWPDNDDDDDDDNNNNNHDDSGLIWRRQWRIIRRF